MGAYLESQLLAELSELFATYEMAVEDLEALPRGDPTKRDLVVRTVEAMEQLQKRLKECIDLSEGEVVAEFFRRHGRTPKGGSPRA